MSWVLYTGINDCKIKNLLDFFYSSRLQIEDNVLAGKLKENKNVLTSLKSLKKGVGSESGSVSQRCGSGSVRQRCGSGQCKGKDSSVLIRVTKPDPDQSQNSNPELKRYCDEKIKS